MLYRTNLKGFFCHLAIMNKIWIRHGKPVAISTTNVEQFFSEFQKATSRLQHQNNLTDHYAQLMCGLFHFRRLSLEKVAHEKTERRKMNSQRNHILEACLDLWEEMEKDKENVEQIWTRICQTQTKKLEDNATNHSKYLPTNNENFEFVNVNNVENVDF